MRSTPLATANISSSWTSRCPTLRSRMMRKAGQIAAAMPAEEPVPVKHRQKCHVKQCRPRWSKWAESLLTYHE